MDTAYEFVGGWEEKEGVGEGEEAGEAGGGGGG